MDLLGWVFVFSWFPSNLVICLLRRGICRNERNLVSPISEFLSGKSTPDIVCIWVYVL